MEEKIGHNERFIMEKKDIVARVLKPRISKFYENDFFA